MHLEPPIANTQDLRLASFEPNTWKTSFHPHTHHTTNQLVMKNGTTIILWSVGCVKKAFEHHFTIGAREGCIEDLTITSIF